MDLVKIEAMIADVDCQLMGNISNSKRSKLKQRRSNLVKALEAAMFQERVRELDQDRK